MRQKEYRLCHVAWVRVSCGLPHPFRSCLFDDFFSLPTITHHFRACEELKQKTSLISFLFPISFSSSFLLWSSSLLFSSSNQYIFFLPSSSVACTQTCCPFTGSEVLIQNVNMVFNWTIDCNTLTITGVIFAKTQGWVSIGFCHTPTMSGSDMIFGYVDNSK